MDAPLWNSFGHSSGADTKDVDRDSTDDSSDEDSCSPSKFEGADFKSSVTNFELSESKRTKLRELEVSSITPAP